MNDILQYWPIRLVYNGRKLMVPMGKIIDIQATDKGKAVVSVFEDSWTTDTDFDDAMAQWNNALLKADGNPWRQVP